MRSCFPLLALLAACGGSDDIDTDTPEDTDTNVESATFSGDVWPILEAECAVCHSDDTWHPGYDLTDAQTAYTALTTDEVDEPANGFTNYVVAGDPDASLIVHKLTEETPGYGGSQMPLNPDDGGPGEPLSDAQIATIVAWIEAGAQND
jgi:mono/diheme cytochrome c family protein